MKYFRQLLRQPLKFIAGVIVVSLAVSVLCVCLGQSIAANKTEEALEYNSGEDMIRFLDNSLYKSFFDKFSLVGYYIEIPSGKNVYVKVELEKNGDILCTIYCEGNESGEQNNKEAVIAGAALSKEWLEQGHDVIFVIGE